MQAGDRPGEFDFFDPRQQVLEGDLKLEPREMRPETEVLTHPEAQMAIGVPIDPKTKRIAPDFFIAIGGGVEEPQGIAFTDLLVAEFVVAGCRAREMDDRTGPTHDFLDRRR